MKFEHDFKNGLKSHVSRMHPTGLEPVFARFTVNSVFIGIAHRIRLKPTVYLYFSMNELLIY